MKDGSPMKSFLIVIGLTVTGFLAAFLVRFASESIFSLMHQLFGG
jgi:hypothetical protein